MVRSLLLVLLLFGPVAGDAAGQAAGAFARLGFGARGIGLSNALVADVSGRASPYYNPALAPLVGRQSLEVTAALLSLDRELQFLQFSAPLRPRAGIAAGLIHAGVSGIDGRDASGYHTDSYATDEFAFFLAFGTRISSRLSAGVALKLFRADYFDELRPVNSIGVDVGLSARITEQLHLGLAAGDLLARYSWDTSDLFGSAGRTTSDRFPRRLRVGASYELLDGRARVLAEYESRLHAAEAFGRSVELVGGIPTETTTTEKVRRVDGRLRMGGELRLAEIFSIRGGIDRVGEDGLGGSVPSAGFSIEQPLGGLGLRAEYAFALEPYAVGTMHFVTLQLLL